MGGEDKENDVFGGGSCMDGGVAKSSSGAAEAYGHVYVGTGSVRIGDCTLTYKRRKNAKALEGGMVWDATGSELFEKNPSDQANKEMPYSPTIPSSYCSLKNQRDIVLEQMRQSIEIECSLQKCIQDALAFHPGSSSRTIGKESVHASEAGSKGTMQNGCVCNGFRKANCGVGMITSSLTDDTKHGTITELCQGILLDIIRSEKFAKLCSLLLGNGMMVEKLLDVSHINSRMMEKVYESSPLQFYSDMQQVWTNLQRVGSDMISLAKCLSEKTAYSFHGQLGCFAHGIFECGRDEFLSQEPDIDIADLIEASGPEEVHTCRQCGESSDGRNGLVCDSCEEIYHVSCIEPAVKEIPTRSWYCANCTAKGIGSPHDNCIPCKRLNASGSLFDGSQEDDRLHGEAPVQLEESSNTLVTTEGDERYQHCKICRTLVGNDEDYRICGHAFCPHKFYHGKCLTSKQLMSHGSCWYCPSCLCRVCLVDRDDDDIVLCDGCDHAYHLYCMQPPQTAVPKGKWFCRKCDASIERIRLAKRSYEIMQNRYKKRGFNGKLKIDDALNKSGGVDMLLNAAKTLNYEENLAAMGLQN